MRRNPKNLTELLSASGLLIFMLLAAGLLLWMLGKDKKADAWWTESGPTSASSPLAPASQTAVPPSLQASPQSQASSQRLNRSHRQALDANSGIVKKAMALIDQGQWGEAESMLQDFLSQNPKNEGALIELAMIKLLDRQDSLAAQPYLEQALQLNPQNEVVVQELLRIYQEHRSWEDGLKFLQSLPAESPYVSYGVGTVLLEMNRPVEAVESLQRSVYELGNQSYDARDGLAEAMWAAGRGDEALQEYQTIIEGPYKSGQVRMAKIRMASALIERGQTEEAKVLLQPLQDSDPSDEFVAYLMRQLTEHRY